MSGTMSEVGNESMNVKIPHTKTRASTICYFKVTLTFLLSDSILLNFARQDPSYFEQQGWPELLETTDY
jgi:hypothetical protein